MEDGRLMGLVSFVVGITLGANWGKIRKWIPKAKKSVANVAESAKEKVVEVATSAADAVVDLSENVTEAVSDTAKKVFHKAETPVKHTGKRGKKARVAASA